MQLNPHLSFNGECEAAFLFYEKCLHGRVAFMLTYGDSPASSEMPAAWQRKIIHATLEIGEQRLTAADTPSYEKPRGFSVLLHVKNAGEAERIYKELSDGASITTAMQETFWALRFAMLTDRFGVPWMINCGKSA